MSLPFKHLVDRSENPNVVVLKQIVPNVQMIKNVVPKRMQLFF